MKNKIIPYDGLGFTIHLIDPPFLKLPDGSQVVAPDIAKLEVKVLKILTKKKSPLTGSQVHFIRTYFELNQMNFSNMLNLSSQSLVSQWEAKRSSFTGMDINTEILLRIKVLEKLGLLNKPINLVNKLNEITPKKIKKEHDIEEYITLKAS